MQTALLMEEKESETGSVVQPITMKKDLHRKAVQAAKIEGLTLAAYVRQLIHKDLVARGFINIE